MTQVTMYTREGCHLCEDAWRLLEQYRSKHAFALEAIDVDGDPALVEQFGNCVPVVTIDGKVRFRGRINPVLLNRILHVRS